MLTRLLLLLLLLLLLPLEAAAKRIVVLPFAGVRGGQVTSQVTRRLSGRHQIVSRGQFVAEARARSLDLGTAIGRSTAARVLKVAAVISGSMKRVRGQWLLRAVVQSGHSGQTVASSAVLLRGLRVDGFAINRLLGGIDRGLAAARTGPTLIALHRTRYRTGPRSGRDQNRVRAFRSPRVASSGPPPDPIVKADPPPAPEPETVVDEGDGEDAGASFDEGDEDEDRPRPRRRAAKRRVAKASSEEDSFGFGEEGEESQRPVDATARYRKRSEPRTIPGKTVEIGIGLSLVNRSFDFSDALNPNTANYRSGVVPALLVQGGLYPFARFGKGFFSNLGVVGSYLRAVGLRSKQPGYTEDANTTLDQFELGLRYRWNILDRPTSAVLKVGLSYGMQHFAIEWTGVTAEQAPLPNISYMYLKLALASLDLPFYVASGFAIGGNASFDYLHVFDAGEIERPDGVGYGKSTTGGIDLGFGAWATYGAFFVRATGFYRRFFYAFDRSCVENGSGCKDAYGAVDAYLGFSATGGVAF
jgi:hypothetical protein